jgi:hypothetical protein
MRTTIFAVVLLATSANAQRSRYNSPQEDTVATFAGKPISVEYYAPSMHGRKVMGALVPYGQVWCTGANWATKLTTENDLQVGGLKLPKGSYSIWTIPNENEWTLIINRETGQFHLNYDQSQDFGRTKMEVKKLSQTVDKFTVMLRPEGENHDHGRLALVWENTEASVPITVLH